jgi:hypothetical protein
VLTPSGASASLRPVKAGTFWIRSSSRAVAAATGGGPKIRRGVFESHQPDHHSSRSPELHDPCAGDPSIPRQHGQFFHPCRGHDQAVGRITMEFLR